MTDTTPRMEVDQEVRFAVVMYGGLSLAIYMNGIAQELLHLVRATAPDPDDPSRPLHPDDGPNGLTPLERVYRQLGQLLGSGGDLERRQAGAAAAAWDVDAPPREPIRTRFVIDILSGTSAGGINAVFLAKALANGQKMDQLKDLWVAEGDVEKLINDDGAVVGGLPAQQPPKSLFSGQRMYFKLVEAFDGMEDPRALSERSTRSPYVDELDLFVTATDLVGLPVPLRLSDAVVLERRHRNVFHFSYGRRRGAVHNDFHAKNNGFLAFAARSTSSFPGAFEPMRLDSVTAALRASGKSWHAGITGHDVERWRAYFPEYRNDGDRFIRRAFADGGYLDNKPLGYAVDQLAHRRASIPVSRKLIYVEPSPEHVNPHADVGEPPGAFSATLSAFTLARYETIREDLERVLARNRLIDRVATLTRGFEEDVESGAIGEPLRMTGKKYGDTFLKEMIEASGIGVWYGGYHRLKVATLSDELAALIANLAGFDERSDDLLAIRYLVRAFRDSRYKRYEEERDDDPRMSEARFLLNYDLSFRVRRLRFVIHQLDTWLRCNAESDLEERRRGKLAEVRRRVRGEAPIDESEAHDDWDAVRGALRDLRAELQGPLADLQEWHEMLHQDARHGFAREGAGAPSPAMRERGQLVVRLQELERQGGITKRALDDILRPRTEKERRAAANAIVERAYQAFLDFADYLATHVIEPVTKDAGSRVAAALDAGSATRPSSRIAREIVSDYYFDFERYDHITFSVLQTADIGEELSRVDVVRISPVDAPSIVDERSSEFPKLAGTALGNFGAFFDEGWRENDILWGRLDGAERIISTLVADEGLRDALVAKAHREILFETLHVPTYVAQRDRAEKTDAADPSALRRAVKRFGERSRPVLEDVRSYHKDMAARLGRSGAHDRVKAVRDDLERASGRVMELRTTLAVVEQRGAGSLRDAVGKAQQHVRDAKETVVSIGGFEDLRGRLTESEARIAEVVADARHLQAKLDRTHRSIGSATEAIDAILGSGAAGNGGTVPPKAAMADPRPPTPEPRPETIDGKTAEQEKALLYAVFKMNCLDLIERRPEPELALRSMARSMRVFGQILDDVGASGLPTSWVARLGGWFVRLVEVAVPNSLKNHFFRHIVSLLRIVWIALFIAGVFFATPALAVFAFIGFLLTEFVHRAVGSLGRWMRKEAVWWARRGRWAYALGGALALILVAWVYVTHWLRW